MPRPGLVNWADAGARSGGRALKPGRGFTTIEAVVQAVILAAGKSTRAFPLTDTRPKPLIPILGKPLLQHQLEQISGLASQAILVIGYLGHQVRDRFGDRFSGLELTYVEQDPPRGTADALARARPLIRERALILNGDDLYHAHDLKALLRHRTGLLVSQAPDPQNRGVVTISGDQVTDIVEKPAAAAAHALCSVGAYTFERGALALLDQVKASPRGELELPELLRLVARNVPVRYHRVERVWCPITYAWDVLSTTDFLLSDSSRARDFGVEVMSLGHLKERRDINLGIGTRLFGPVLVGPGVTFGNYCRIRGPAVIEAGCALGDCVEIDRSVLFRGARVGEFARVSHSVLGELAQVGPEARVLSSPAPGEPSAQRVGGPERIATGVGSPSQERDGAPTQQETVKIELRGAPVDTGLEELGLIAGDRARVPAKAETPPGTLLESGETYGSSRALTLA